jgi:hypothetical protein
MITINKATDIKYAKSEIQSRKVVEGNDSF